MEPTEKDANGTGTTMKLAGETPPGEPVSAQQFRRVPAFTRGPQPQLDFTPVSNGLDYLVSVVNHLDENESEVTPRDVKYAVLHLEAAVELLLKARLHSEHWTLVFTDLQKVTPKQLEESTFQTVGAEKALERLKTFVKVDVTQKDKTAVSKLVKHRNRLQHFGFTGNASEVENLAGEVLDFLIRFIDDQLLPYLQDESEKQQAEKELLSVRTGLTRIHSFVTERMSRLGVELQEERAENRTIECPECEQLALVVGKGTATCRFCSSVWDGHELAGVFSSKSWAEPGPWMECPECDEWTLGSDVRLRSDPGLSLYFCFCCANGFPELSACDRCSRPTQKDGGGNALCASCWNGLMDQEREAVGHVPDDYSYGSETGA
ncbi:serine/arginine repetitive matrix protein 1 [Streptomyces poriferorum]|uniref:Serine/arginine repetitive matrix protein 1 n=1 Tax=Streptomyces poriferorum TaxID=2798799 RepID=A0ABY9J6W5_9ACTN|nr:MULTISPECIES: serine/arginine repetitive matrix protein 1 [unclassified Streptomyces]MDP5317387.1 serine/arginine repetitive matrix protein 1 [Streptomyces sp. Alt4]WLQ61993.1 serine/arginine repetitive matrix protein 1 [Streptomyces sp. Alt2]